MLLFVFVKVPRVSAWCNLQCFRSNPSKTGPNKNFIAGLTAHVRDSSELPGLYFIFGSYPRTAFAGIHISLGK